METESQEDSRRGSRRRAWLVRLGLVAAAAVVTVVIVRLVGRIDWGAVGAALGHLAWWHPLVLVAVLVVRQVFNALPLALYIPGVSVVRATLNDQGAALTAVVAPPPGDLALRVAMFTSWGVPPAKAIAGTVMNTLTFYIVRFSAPVLGFVLLAVSGRSVGLRWLDLLSIACGAATFVGVLAVLRSDSLARKVGRSGASAMRRLGRPVDPDDWAAACSDFRRDIAERFNRGFPRSVAGLLAMLVVDIALLTLCLRFVGVSASEASVLDIGIAFLFAYPLTVLPAMGLGVVDALILAALVESGGSAVESTAVAALIVWRVFTIAGPVLLGAGAVALWRRNR